MAVALIYLLFAFVCECCVVGVPSWACAVLERGLETAQWAENGEMRPERAFQRTLEHMQDVILGRGLNTFVMCIF